MKQIWRKLWSGTYITNV